MSNKNFVPDVPARAPSVTKLFQPGSASQSGQGLFTEKFVNHLGRLDRAAGASADRLTFTLENRLKLPLVRAQEWPRKTIKGLPRPVSSSSSYLQNPSVRIWTQDRPLPVALGDAPRNEKRIRAWRNGCSRPLQNRWRGFKSAGFG
ncbi:hypothetical protein ACLKA6_017630 [Drosophila palustris]